MNKWTAVMLVVAFGVSASATAAEPPSSLETVLVQSNSLDGVWKISAPIYSGGLSLFHGFQGPLRKMQNLLCRVNDRILRCIGPALMMEGTVSVDGTRAHFAWGTIMTRPVIAATFDSATQFTGVFSFKLSGIEYTAPDPANGTKLNLAATSQNDDKDGLLLKRVLEDMTSGTSSELYDTQSPDVQIMPPDALQPLGAALSAIYVGESGEFVRPQDPKAPFSAKYKIPTDYRVYDVEFANGERLCGLRHGPDGRINGFRCV